METLNFEKQDHVGILKINRPQAMNALNGQLLSELDELLIQLSEDKTLRVLIVTGEGEKAFVAGADIKEMKDHSSDEAFKMAQNGQRIFSKLESLPFATIACVNGFALGGGMELALSCDMIVASEKAKFGLPEVSLGLIPGYGGTQRLARVVGANNARRIIFSGEMFSAEQAKSWGLVSEVYSPEDLMTSTLKLAKSISFKAPLAVSAAKKSLYEGIQTDLESGLQIEAEGFKEVFKTKDHDEGISAFMEKRRADFKGE